MYFLFDIGGTKMRFATSEDGISLSEIQTFETPDKFEEAFSYFSKFKDSSYEAVAGGLAGILNKEKSQLISSPNLRSWVEVPIKNMLEELFKSRVILENDAALAGLGEACHGAGKDSVIVAYITISTGIGGARIIDGKIDRHSYGFEPGKEIIDFDMSSWPESAEFNPDNLPLGSVESFVSGAALNYRFGVPPSDIKDEKVWGEVERLVAVTLNNTVAFWSPDVIVLGGGMVLEEAVSIDRIRDNLGRICIFTKDLPETRKAELGEKSALLGAAVLAIDKKIL